MLYSGIVVANASDLIRMRLLMFLLSTWTDMLVAASMNGAARARNCAAFRLPVCPQTFGTLICTLLITGKNSHSPAGTVQVRVTVLPTGKVPARNQMGSR